MIYQYVCSLTGLSIRILLVFERASLVDTVLLNHDRGWVLIEAALLSVGRLLCGVMTALSTVVGVHVSQLRTLVQNCLRDLGLSSCGIISGVTGALKTISKLACVNTCRAIRWCWSLVHASVTQTVGWLVGLSLIDVVVISHDHLSEPGLVAASL